MVRSRSHDTGLNTLFFFLVDEDAAIENGLTDPDFSIYLFVSIRYGDTTCTVYKSN